MMDSNLKPTKYEWPVDMSKDTIAQKMAEEKLGWHDMLPAARIAQASKLLKLAQQIKETL